MFVVRTDHPNEQALLEQEHPSVNQHFCVAMKQASCLTTIIRSILFEYFRGVPPLLAKKITQLVIDSLNMTLSLTLFRQILALVRTYSETVKLFNDYFAQQSAFIPGDHEVIGTIQEEMSQIDELILLQDSRCSKIIYTTEFQQTLDRQINHRSIDKPLKSKKTGIRQEGETILGSFISKQKLELSLKKVLSNTSLNNDYQWWKHQNIKDHIHQNNQSQSIVQFDRKGSPLMKQDSINELMRREVEIDSNIQSQYFIRDDRIKQINRVKFNKKMKERLISAKLKKRKRRR